MQWYEEELILGFFPEYVRTYYYYYYYHHHHYPYMLLATDSTEYVRRP